MRSSLTWTLTLCLVLCAPAATAAQRASLVDATATGTVVVTMTQTGEQNGVKFFRTDVTPATVTAMCPAGALPIGAAYKPVQPHELMPIRSGGRWGWRATFSESSHTEEVSLRALCLRGPSGVTVKTVTASRTTAIDFAEYVTPRCGSGAPVGLGWRHTKPEVINVDVTRLDIRKRTVSAGFFAPNADSSKLEVVALCLVAKGQPHAALKFATVKRDVLPSNGAVGDATVRCPKGARAFGVPWISIIKGVDAGAGENREPGPIAVWPLSAHAGTTVEILPVHKPRPGFGETPHKAVLSQPCMPVGTWGLR